MFCSMISDLEDREQTQSLSLPTTHSTTWNCFYTHRPDHRSGSSHSNRRKLSRHSSLSVSTMTHLCSSLSPPSSCLYSTDRKWKRKNRPVSHCKAKKLKVQTAFIHGASLSCAVLNPSLAWALSVSPALSLWSLLPFSLQRDKAAVEEVAHPRGWKLVSHPTLKAVFTQNIVSVPKHVRGSYL